MTDVSDFDHEIQGECRSRQRDRALAALAARQHGVVARRQLLELGIGTGAVDHRVAIARLQPVHRGVYSVGPAHPGPRARWMAAVLACGPGALLSHRSAAALWGLRAGGGPAVEVSVPGQRCRGRPGIVLHRLRTLDAEDLAVRDGIPVTALPRTLLDLAEVVSPARLEFAFEDAERLRILDLRAIGGMWERAAGRRGLRALAGLLSEAHEPPDTRSELERRFVRLCREAGLPLPALNTMVAGVETDAVWPQERLIVELDGFAYHHTRAAFERDRARDADLQLAGYRVVRVTARRLDRDPAAVVAALRSLLAAGS